MKMKKRYLLAHIPVALGGYVLGKHLWQKLKTFKQKNNSEYIVVHENGMFEVSNLQENDKAYKNYGVVLKIQHPESNIIRYNIIIEDSEEARMKAIDMYSKVFSGDITSSYDITNEKLEEIAIRLFSQKTITNNRKEDKDEFYKV